MAKQMTITIETNSLVVLRARSTGKAWCARCSAEGELFRLRRGSTPAGVEQLFRSGDVHLDQAPDGSTLICLNSLMALLKNQLKSRGHNVRAINTTVEEI